VLVRLEAIADDLCKVEVEKKEKKQ